MMKEHPGSGIHITAYVHSSAVQDEGAAGWKLKADECQERAELVL
jgi:hypothetical protein